MTPHRLRSIGLRTLQASGALLIAGLMTGCGAPGGPNGQVITAPTQTEQPAPPAGGSDARPAPPTSGAGDIGEQTPGEPPAMATQPGKVERCHTSMLSGSLAQPDAGAGQRYAELVLRNSSSETCTLYGYGGMQLIDQSGRPLPTDMTRVPNPGPTLITLAPGETASATLHWTAVPHEGEPEDAPCQPTPARAEVIPPDETDPLSITWTSGPVCGFGSIDGSAYHQ
ncbi:DUF4232 domain-containing protein [Saccharopolyspora sp. K220]|uniref:DUF4232 domain-containing protein n=1 Tax=Saccharopolyspora soli TaxID=2926618 RepID=UPI001F5AB664|nr:DUF4232 domain-containing protein [Saccharopolyspora soli]MCI2423803.1 DUF4232 domain-containing protein [Saccharopolyspora soli]